MQTVFNLIVFVHVVFAILWIGSAAVLELLEWEASHESARERLARTLARGGWFAKRVFAPCAAGTLASGIAAVAVGRPEFGQLWVILALVFVVLVSALGALGVGRSMAQLAARMASGADAGEVEMRNRRIRALSHLDLALLFLILFDMVMRPTGPDPVFFSISGAFLGGVLAWVALSWPAAPRYMAA